MERRMHVRYGRVDNVPKNTLVTLRDGETLFFGIARCRLGADTAMKEEGKRWASFRALRSATGNDTAEEVDGTMQVHPKGMSGSVHITEVKKLLDYFDNIDEIQLRKLNGK